jgi:superfamily II DNA helicase RecQ
MGRLWQLLDETVAADEGPAIVYCARIRTVEELHLKASDRGLPHSYYHGDLDNDVRIGAEERFLRDQVPVIFSTKAFGMGVHKSNVRRVINAEMTDSLEEYLQEAGRAGRDGLPADCILLYQPHDVYLQRAFVNGANPSLDFIKGVYSQRWRYTPREVQTDAVPEVPFSMRRFLAGFEQESHYMRQKITAAFAQLVEYKVLEVTPSTLRFLLKPDQVKRADFPITEQMIETKRAYDFQRLQIMLHYALSEDPPRETILGHFNNNSIVEKIGASKIEDAAILDPEHVKQILRAVYSKDYDRRHLPSILSGKRGEDMDASMRLPELSNFESRLEVEYAASRGLIRMVRVGRKTLVTITADGLEALEADGVVIEPIQTYAKLRNVMLSSAGQFTLRASLRKWVDGEKTSNSNPRDQMKERLAWWNSFDDFRREKFQILDKKITGLQLVAHFMRVAKAHVHKRDIKSFLNLLFDNKIP